VKVAAQRDELVRMLQIQPDLVVIDEAHRIKNPLSDMSKVLGEVHTTRRLALTGTPLQNNLMEYYTMVKTSFFIRPLCS
jgi:transcriptional regulator ATRX